ncbi:MAG: glycosyltransferase [Candidatus Symbiothrix sp.]|jgi:glycosyltransferase involved in cell wall biosynthesis|nr:glycosyltransferase [Candidatus Symbiothrix sp.]
MTIINASGLRNSGALTILHQFYRNIPVDNRQYIIFVDISVELPENNNNVLVVKVNKRSFIRRILWDLFGLKAWLKRNGIVPDVTISLQNSGFRTIGKCKKFVYFHNLLPVAQFQWNIFKKAERILWYYKNVYALWVKWSISRDTQIFVQSNHIKEAFAKRYNFHRTQIHVIFPEIQLPEVSVPKSENNTSTVQFFYPATEFVYKNHKILFEAFKIIDEQLTQKIQIFLTVAQDFVEDFQYKNVKINSLGFISQSEMSEMYASVDALLFPSYLETVGLPVLEAASFGLPILVADASYAREVLEGYDGVQFIDYKDANEWGKAILYFCMMPLNHYSPFRPKDKYSWKELFEIIK